MLARVGGQTQDIPVFDTDYVVVGNLDVGPRDVRKYIIHVYSFDASLFLLLRLTGRGVYKVFVLVEFSLRGLIYKCTESLL